MRWCRGEEVRAAGEQLRVLFDGLSPVAEAAGQREVRARKVLAVGGHTLSDAVVLAEPINLTKHVVLRGLPYGHVVDVPKLSK